MAGLTGRLPVKRPEQRFPLKYASEYLATPLPTPTYPIDVSEGITDFGMMGNDSYGDCGPAAEVHLEMTTAKAAGGAAPDPNATTALDRYTAYTGTNTPPGPGVNLADYLKWCYDQHYILAFAPVQTTPAEIDAFMQAGFGCYVGVNLTDDAVNLFDAGEPWTVAGGQQPDPNEGHCILKVQADGQGTDGYVTWGKVQKATSDWSAACIEEAWLVVTTEEQLAKFTQSLLADVQALDGTGPAPTPAPAPEPVPTPSPVPAPTPTPEPPAPPSPAPEPPSPPSPSPDPVSPPSPEPAPSPLERFKEEVVEIIEDVKKKIEEL